MKSHLRFYVFLALSLVFTAGCSALPGLRVLSGQQSPEANTEQIMSQEQLIMADKASNTDPALLAAADRIEAANLNRVDILRINQDVANDKFDIDLLWLPDLPQNATFADELELLRRVTELTWQGFAEVSQGSDLIDINVMFPQQVDTIDHGPSFAAALAYNLQISRADMLNYLAQRPNSMDDFNAMIVAGKLQYGSAREPRIVPVEPNHPVFLPSLLMFNQQAAPAAVTEESSG